MALPVNFLRISGRERDLGTEANDTSSLRKEIEPWLSAVFQSEHFSLLLGNGFTTGIATGAGVTPVPMSPPEFEEPHADKVTEHAQRLAREARRGAPNIEDQLRAALQLIGGLDVLCDESVSSWRDSVSQALGRFAGTVLETERAIATAVDSDTAAGASARDDLVSFLLSFASRAASRDRLNLFTTNYDRLIEYGCDLIGLRPIDRFVGGLAPRFRASRLDVDMHYNPPGIRGEPRYLEGVVRLTKLHGSIDWRFDRWGLTRIALPFGSVTDESTLASGAYESLIIYPNPAKDIETLEYPYAELFRDFSSALCRPNSALVTYGFGFGDDHINRIIADMLTIPSTHLVIIAFEDTGDRVETFLERVGHRAQVSLLVGHALGELSTLVAHYLPKPAIDVVTLREAELLRRRAVDKSQESEATSAPE